MSLEFEAPASITNSLSLICRSTPNLKYEHSVIKTTLTNSERYVLKARILKKIDVYVIAEGGNSDP